MFCFFHFSCRPVTCIANRNELFSLLLTCNEMLLLFFFCNFHERSTKHINMQMFTRLTWIVQMTLPKS